MSSSAEFLATAFQFALVIGGALLLWRLGLSARARQTPKALTAWNISFTDFFMFLWFVLCGGLLAPYLLGFAIRGRSYPEDTKLIFATAAFQLGMLGGVLLFHFLPRSRRADSAPAGEAPPPPRRVNPLLAGAATFLITMPVVLVVSLLWQALLSLVGLPAPQQEAIEVLRNAKSVVPVIGLFASAVVIAPVTEELVFRAGFFRYVRTRLPRWAALSLPACIFAALHNNLASFLPLAALGVVFSLAYERTGRVATTIVAHALFNLTATLLVLVGVDT